MKFIILFLFANICLAQDLDSYYQITKFIDELNNVGPNLGRVLPTSCPNNELDHPTHSDPNKNSEYSCAYKPRIKMAPGHRLFALIPEEHPLAKKYKTRIVSIGITSGTINDNTWEGSFAYYLSTKKSERYNNSLRDDLFWGDDRGMTFGIDYGGEMILQVSENQNIKIALNKRLRQFSQKISGATYIDQRYGQMMVLVDSESSRWETLRYSPIEDFPRNLENFSMGSLINQASLSLEHLELDIVLDQPVVDLGLGVGLKKLDDTPSQSAAKIQDNWHKSRDIYRYNWEDFSNLIVDGVYHYLTISPQVSLNSPELSFFNGICKLNSTITAGATVNVPLQKESFKMNTIQPFVKNKINLGIIPTKKFNTGKSRFELEVETLIDPLNQTPLNVDPGAIGSLSAGLNYNQPIGARTMLTVIPIRMHFPIYGKQENSSLLSSKILDVNGMPVKTVANEREFTADWLTIKLNQRIEPFPKN
jgi:hypothetical protein